MKMQRNAISLVLLLTGISSFITSISLAYVPPADYQIQQLVKKHAAIKGVRVRSRITNGEMNLKETLWYEASTRLLRGKITNETGDTVYTYQKKLSESGITASSLIFESSFTFFLKGLSAEGIDLDEKTGPLGLGRVKQHIGWIIGKNSPSFWVLKDEFLPLKWVPKSSGPEIIFDETKTQKDFPYSRLITANENGKEVLRVEAIEVSINPDLSDLKSMNFKTDDPPQLKMLQDLIAWIR